MGYEVRLKTENISNGYLTLGLLEIARAEMGGKPLSQIDITPPKTIAPSRPLPTGSASTQAFAGWAYHSLCSTNAVSMAVPGSSACGAQPGL